MLPGENYKGAKDTGSRRGEKQTRVGSLAESWGGGFILIPQGTLYVSYALELVPTWDQRSGLSSMVLQSITGKSCLVGRESPGTCSPLKVQTRRPRVVLRWQPLVQAQGWAVQTREETPGNWVEHWQCPLETYLGLRPQLASLPCCFSSKTHGLSSPVSPWGTWELPGTLCPGNWDFFHNSYYSIRPRWYFNKSSRFELEGWAVEEICSKARKEAVQIKRVSLTQGQLIRSPQNPEIKIWCFFSGIWEFPCKSWECWSDSCLFMARTTFQALSLSSRESVQWALLLHGSSLPGPVHSHGK